MTTASSGFSSNATERVLLRLESAPFHALYRVLIGLLVLPAHRAVWPADPPAWSLPLVALVVLGMLRVIPALARKVVPFSPQTRALWAERRLRGKRYDSYQWRKALWIGVGLAISIGLTESYGAAAISIATVCLLGGVIGVLRWRHISGHEGRENSDASQTA
jgi:hypothetical protein